MRLLAWFRRPASPAYHRGCPECAGLEDLVRDGNLPGLIDVLKTDRRHQTEAAASLAYLTGRDLGPDPAAWKSWCRKQKSLTGAAVE